MRNIIMIAVSLVSFITYGQVGINNSEPKATFDISAQTTDGSKPEGMIAPRLTGDQIKAADTRYGLAQKGALIFATEAVTTASSKTSSITSEGYYYFDGNQWQKILNDTSIGNSYYGDIKPSIISSDHNGWVKLDGRAISALTTSQQAVANSLNLNSNLPDASNSYLGKNNQTLGSVTGSNTLIIQQNQLPNIIPSITIAASSAGTPTGSISVDNTTSTMQTAGNHYHLYQRSYNLRYNEYDPLDLNAMKAGMANSDRPIVDVFPTLPAGSHTHTMKPHNHTAGFDGFTMSNHSHTATSSSINGGGVQQSLDIAPKSMSVNMFIYLGN